MSVVDMVRSMLADRAQHRAQAEDHMHAIADIDAQIADIVGQVRGSGIADDSGGAVVSKMSRKARGDKGKPRLVTVRDCTPSDLETPPFIEPTANDSGNCA